MFGLGFLEIAIILVLALLIFGPKKLPDLARGLGKSLREFRQATEDFRSTLDDEAYRGTSPSPTRPASVDRALPPPADEPRATPVLEPDGMAIEAALPPTRAPAEEEALQPGHALGESGEERTP